MTEIRQSSGTLTLVEEFSVMVMRDERPYRQRMVRLLCGCGRTVEIPLSRWVHQTPEKCRVCSIKKAKGRGYHGFLARPRG